MTDRKERTFHVVVVNKPGEWFANAEDALQHAARNVYLSADGFANGRALLEGGSAYSYCYGFQGVFIAPADREGRCDAGPNELADWSETCGECYNEIPVVAGGSLANPHHAQSCSLFDVDRK